MKNRNITGYNTRNQTTLSWQAAVSPVQKLNKLNEGHDKNIRFETNNFFTILLWFHYTVVKRLPPWAAATLQLGPEPATHIHFTTF